MLIRSTWEVFDLKTKYHFFLSVVASVLLAQTAYSQPGACCL
jgi:hypothetical protein